MGFFTSPSSLLLGVPSVFRLYWWAFCGLNELQLSYVLTQEEQRYVRSQFKTSHVSKVTSEDFETFDEQNEGGK